MLRKQIGEWIWSSNVAYGFICLCHHHVRFESRWAEEFLLGAAGAGKQGESICLVITEERSTQKDTEVIMTQIDFSSEFTDLQCISFPD